MQRNEKKSIWIVSLAILVHSTYMHPESKTTLYDTTSRTKLQATVQLNLNLMEQACSKGTT